MMCRVEDLILIIEGVGQKILDMTNLRFLVKVCPIDHITTDNVPHQKYKKQIMYHHFVYRIRWDRITRGRREHYLSASYRRCFYTRKWPWSRNTTVSHAKRYVIHDPFL